MRTGLFFSQISMSFLGPISRIGLMGLIHVAMIAQADDDSLELHLRSRVKDTSSETKTESWSIRNTSARWNPKETALIICDMWDDHWCKSAARRVVELAGPMNQLVKDARAQGIFIIHAPSSVVDFYQDTPPRQRAQTAPFAKPPVSLSQSERWGTTWCWPDESKEPGMPVDDSDMGCDCPTKCEIREAWTRQIAALEIADEDAITDHGQETYNLLADRGIQHVILMGVHLNMCVLGRPFGIRQMVKVGQDVVLVRDMTDTMYDPRQEPKVSHFAGTDLVVEHVERYWCPSILSTDLTGRPPFQFQGAKP